MGGDGGGEQEGRQVDANAIVSYNLRAIRQRYGWTQEAVADRLGRLTGQRLTKSSISAMERGFDGERRRRFDAHELYLLSQVFEVPMAYFFAPPAEEAIEGQVLADTGRSVYSLYAAFLGRFSQLEVLDERLAQVDVGGAGCTERVLEALFGTVLGTLSWSEHYRRWREDRLYVLADGWGNCSGDELVEAVSLLTKFVWDVRELRWEVFADEQPGPDSDSGELGSVGALR